MSLNVMVNRYTIRFTPGSYVATMSYVHNTRCKKIGQTPFTFV